MNLNGPARVGYLAGDLEGLSYRFGCHRRQLSNLFYPRASRPRPRSRLEYRQRLTRTCSSDLDVAVGPVPHPSGKRQLLRFLDDEPAKSNTLYKTADLEVNRIHPR